jgi:hypothetical protein
MKYVDLRYFGITNYVTFTHPAYSSLLFLTFSLSLVLLWGTGHPRIGLAAVKNKGDMRAFALPGQHNNRHCKVRIFLVTSCYRVAGGRKFKLLSVKVI